MGLSIETLVLSKKHTNEVALGISSMSVSGTTVTFQTTDGKTAKVTVPTPADGVSITKATVDENNHLICTLSNKSTIDAGEIQTLKGDKGDKGDQGVKGDKGEKGDAGKPGEQGEKAKMEFLFLMLK